MLAFPCLHGTKVDPGPQGVSKRRVLARDRVTGPGLVNCVGACCGTLTYDYSFSRCILIVNGDVTAEQGPVAFSLVVCGGDIRLPRSVMMSGVIVAAGSVELGKCGDSLIVAGGAVRVERADACTVKERQKSLAPFVTFFDPATRGIVVEAATGGVRVAKLTAGKSFAKAGFREGDLIAAVNGVKVATPEAFRRALAEELTETEEVAFAVVRGGEARELTARFDD